MSTATTTESENLAGQSQPVVQARTSDDIFFADWPHRFPGCEALDKYDLRRWLIGYATLRLWTWTREGDSGIVGFLTLGWLSVRIEVVTGGLLLSDGERTELIKTRK